MADSGSGGKRPVGTGTAGCLAVSLGFALCGSVFVWSFFAAVRVRGNPYFGLVMGSAMLAAVRLLPAGSGAPVWHPGWGMAVDD